MRANLENYIQRNIDALDKKEPDPVILERILQQMAGVKKPALRAIVIPYRSLWWAAACIAALALGFTLWQFRESAPAKTMAKKTAPVPAQTKPTEPQRGPAADTQLSRVAAVPSTPKRNEIKHPGIDAVNEDLANRKEKLALAIKDKKMLSFAGFGNISSAAGRINAIAATTVLKHRGNDITDALLNVLNKDPNTNVRLAALDGLAGFYEDAYTGKKLLAALKKQSDPVVQIALIGLLTRMRESGILEELEKMVRDQGTEKTVKDCAWSSILQLNT